MTLALKKYRHRHIANFMLQAVDVLHQKMHAYNKEAKEILVYLIEQIKIQNKNAPALKSLYQLMAKADEVVIECASKLAPYQSAKLESIEVKSKIQHTYVIRTPNSVKSVDEWQKLTGAEKLPAGHKVIERKLAEIEPSVHDFDVEDDEIETIKQLH